MYSDGVITLAPFEREDLDCVHSWVNDAELARAIDRVLPVTQWEHDRWYESLIARADAVTFAVRHVDQPIGLCGLKGIHPRSRHAELWLYIGEPAKRGLGLGHRAISLLCRFGFEQLNLHRIHLYVAEYNEKALEVYRRCGFREEGRDREHLYLDGAYHDAIRMGLLRRELVESATTDSRRALARGRHSLRP